MVRNRLDRTLRLEPTPADQPAEIAEIQFRDEWGRIVQRFDPALLGMPDDISAAISCAFRDHDVASSAATRTSRWFALRVFGRFLCEDGRVRRAVDLDTATIRRFITWLAKPTNGRRRGVQSQSGQLGMIRPVLKRAIADNPGLFAPGFAVPNNAIPLAGVQRLPQDRLTTSAMRALLAVCYAEIDTAWDKFQHGQTIVALPNLPLHGGRTAERDRWIWKLHRLGHGVMPPARGSDLNKPDRQRIADAGGFRELESYLHLTTDTLVAFYIVLLIQTAANAGPLRQIKRDCLVPHPLERHRVMVEWVKPRAGGKVKRMQRRSFDNRRPYAAPRLIEKLLAMTAPLLPHVEPSRRDRLFLHRFLMTTGRLERDHHAGHIVQATLRSAMLRFYERQNAAIASWNEAHPEKPRALLPDFSPKLFRSSMAMLAEPCPCADRYPNPEWPLRRLAFMLDRLGDACFTVIAYLVGARASEILRLEEGCLERRATDEDGEEQVYLVGTITKTSLTEHGDIHRWLAPEPVQRAIHILERLSAPLRELSGEKNLWLHQLGRGRSPLPTMMPVARLRSPMVNVRLNERLAPFLALPDHQGGTWPLTTYQGRKTFSRFIGRRDRTGLTALQRHLGHVHRAMTDRAYVGTDFELAELIDEQAAEETRKALEDLLLAPHVAGKAGVMLSERSPFRGRTGSGDVDAYITEILAETDMRLGVCDWGYCLYRRETSACLGGEREPNPVLRTQSTCSSCANFAVTDRHRPVWEARLERNTALTQRDELDAESRALAEARIQESLRILAQLDKGNADGVRD